MKFLSMQIFTFVLFALVSSVPAQLYNKTGQVVFLGDSITEWWKYVAKNIWDEHYEPLGAVNTGIAGHTTTDVINRIINEGIVDNLHAYQAVLKIGTNDIARGVSNSDVIKNIQTIIELTQERNPGVRVILLGILPRGDADLHQKIREVNIEIAKFADNKVIYFLDMEPQFSTGLGNVRPELYGSDQLHLTREGYAVWAREMGPLFNEVLVAPRPAKIVWMGDSISYFWRVEGRPIWDASFAPLKTLNLAIPGHTSADALYLIEKENVLEGLNPKVAVLLIGVNDLINEASPSVVIANIERIVQHFKEQFAHARIILLGVLPSSMKDVNLQAKLVNNDLQAMNNEDDVYYLDMGSVFADENGDIFKDLYVEDGLHLALPGYVVWNETMWSRVEKLLQFT